ncbi:MAG TPA: response regulator [Desulfobacteraceae bacterium]|nr:response regulator [Desulfobacteraceae bacterium]HPJ67705.1 response regulator [Desulfobacteraceae bacterium]HPQ29418.1 response regulator [Desulfobacteraceae bacterium]
MGESEYLDGKKILIVDDEEDVLESLEELLPMCVISTASNREEALNLMETQAFDLCILDIMGVDGYGLLQRANERKLLTVMLTAHAFSPENTLKALKEGAASYLPKEKMDQIEVFLKDVFEAEKKGKHHWSRWFERLGSYYERKFGTDWTEEKELMKKLISY